MLRLGIVALVIALGVVPAHAAGSGAWRSLGMYPTTSGGPAPAAPMPMVESKVEIVVRGAIVEAVVTQAFVNRSDRATEATYIFPLPHDAAVSAMSIKIGTKTIKAAIEKRAEAQRRYEAAVRAGVMAAVTEQERSDVFTQTIAAVPAKGRVEIVLRFDTTASFADGAWMLALPMVVAPRFVPGAASGRGTTGSGRSPDTDRAPDASRITPGASPGGGGATSVTITFADPVKDVTSQTHDVKGPTNAIYSFVDKVTDHDAVIRWKSKAAAVGWIESTQDGGFAAVVVQAPEASSTKRTALRAMFVLDRAATMKGDATVTAQPFVRTWFNKLRGDDRVALTGAAALVSGPPMDALRTIEAVWRQPGAPFDLTRTLQTAKPDGAPLVIVTDGLVADDAAAIAAAKKLGVPVHVIGVGAAPARGLLVRLAATTGGTVRFILPADDLSLAASGLAQDLASTPAPLAVNWGTLSVTDVVPATLPRLGVGQAMIVVAKVRRTHAATPTANIRVRGELFSIETLPPAKSLDGAVTSAGPLARRWAKLRLDDLLVGAPNVPVVTAHALAYGLVSPYTSLVAIGDDVVIEGGVKHSVAVPVSVPAGMHWVEVKQETTPTTFQLDSKLEQQRDPNATVVTQTDNQRKPPVVAGRTTEKKPEGPPGAKAPPERPVIDKNDGDSRDASKQEPRKAAGEKSVREEDEEPKSAKKKNRDDDEEGADDGESYGGGAPAPDVATAPAEGGVYEDSYGRSYESTVERSMSPDARRRGFRFSLSAGGGIAVQASERAPLFSLGMRFDAGRGRNMFGLEGSLFGVGHDDGLDGQGRFLLSYSRLGAILPLLELGAGVGAHVGAGFGPAWSLSLRIHLTPRFSGYARYDGARLIQEDSASQTQTTTTLGLEAGF